MNAETPEYALDDGDPGDDIFRRYRYQATYAAIVALGTLQRDSNILEVFAEHHDDILVKLQSKRFNAVQVKTQKTGGNPFKSSDDEIRKALRKFISHERWFGDAFERYTIVTNHHFFKSDNAASLHFIMEKSKEATGDAVADMDSRLSRFINPLVKEYNKGRDKDDRATRGDALAMLQKLHLDDSLPKMQGIHQELRDTIARSDGEYRAATYTDLDLAAEALERMACSKSSLPNDDAAYLYLAYAANPAKAEQDAVIEAKRITRDHVVEILTREISAGNTLAAADPIDPSTLPRDLSTADKKMTAGKLSATTVAASRDWQASAEYLHRTWVGKYGEAKAVGRYNHVATAVQTACSEAYESTRSNAPQGPAMLKKLKECLKLKRRDGTELFDCEEEHLLGHAVIRTEQCKVWWSTEFDLD